MRLILPRLYKFLLGKLKKSSHIYGSREYMTVPNTAEKQGKQAAIDP
jgi:hypothetical protein